MSERDKTHTSNSSTSLCSGLKSAAEVITGISFFGRTLADNHLRGCYGVTGGVGRARKLAMRRAPGLDDIGGEVGDVDPRVPPARTRTSARFDVNLTVGGLLD
ncbi:jg19249 [Pararge aegeria aegeria]|uniref:Jg19249 protein n=1 Tax=Pararge aegeria aegeria TaxID=348720 RepID=A0A8S4SBX5_9NEOP|nr:jg19249 [Pararge aegeria aegeria]